jgi:molybdopterin-guanine dinucleotide biosynthesis protein B
MLEAFWNRVDEHMKIFGIAGFKNAGKTTLIVELIHVLKSRGLRVATIKHAHHEFDIDHPGKDSFLHREAGAREVIVASSRRWAHICELDDGAEPDLQELLGHLGDTDLVLIEGYKHGTHPRLELRRAGVEAPELAGLDANIIAIVSDAIVQEASVTYIARNDVEAIADFVSTHAGDWP